MCIRDSLYTDHYVNDDGSNAELQGLETLLAYAEKHHFACLLYTSRCV